MKQMKRTRNQQSIRFFESLEQQKHSTYTQPLQIHLFSISKQEKIEKNEEKNKFTNKKKQQNDYE